MIAQSTISAADRERISRSGCPRSDFLEGGGYSGIPLFRGCASSHDVFDSDGFDNFRARQVGVDAASLWTQRTRPRVIWKLYRAQFSTASTPIPFS
jgi:hypothetical protein